MDRWAVLFRSIFRRTRVEREIDAELRFHLDQQIEENLANDMDPDEARLSALRSVGSRAHIADECRDSLGLTLLDALLHDVTYAFRSLRASPGFTAVAVVTLALGVGANTAVFTLVHGVLLRSLPVTHAGRLYKFGDEYKAGNREQLQGSWSLFPYPFYREILNEGMGFEELAAMQTLRPSLSVRSGSGTGIAEPFTGEFVSGNYFTTLGVQALAGRMFEARDDRAGAAPVVVASYGAWQKYGFDASVIGQPLTINGVTVTLLGVTPPAFFGDRLESQPPDFWLPLCLEPAFAREGSLLEEPAAGWLYIIGRLGPGSQPLQVQAQLTAALRNYLRVPGHVNHADDVKKIDEQVVPLTPGGGGMNAMKAEYQQGLYLLLAVSAAVLLIACANLANLLLARGAARRIRTTVELALGAPQRRIVSRYVTESLVLALAGGAAGLTTAVYASRATLLIAFRGAPHVPIATTPSVAMLLFTFAVSVVSAVLFGAAPAWLAARSDPADALRSSTRVVAGAVLPQRSLVVLQASLSLVLLTIAGLLTQSLRNLDTQPFGFEPSGRLVVTIDPQSAGYTQPRLEGLYRRIDDRLSRVPSVVSESLSLYTVQQNDSWGSRIYLDGGAGPFPASWDRVSARYFQTIGTPIVRGRGIDEHDTADSRRVAVVNEAFVREYFADQDPTGRHFGKYEPGHAADYEIVGVVKDAKYTSPSAAVRPMFFVPLLQTVRYAGDIPNKIEESSRYMGSIELHVHGDPDAVAPAVRSALADVDPNLPPTSIKSFPELIRTTTSERTLIARLSDTFGAIALLLAAVGLYGVTAYRVTRRTNEIGLRMALGASRRDIAALVIGGALSQTIVGLLVGVPLALVAARALQHQLFGVSPFNLPALATAATVVAGCALVASAVPARRAATIAPMAALRTE